MMLSEAAFQSYAKTAELQACTITELEVLQVPFHDMLSLETLPAVAYRARVTTANPGETPRNHTVHISLHDASDGQKWSMWCGDRMADGQLSADDAKNRIQQAFPALKGKALTTAIGQVYAVFEPSDPCNFWITWKSAKQPCKHILHVLAHLRDSTDDFMQKLKDAHDAMVNGSSASAAAAESSTDVDKLAFKVPVLLEGDRGSGKTTTVRSFARANSFAYVEYGGHERTEATDLLGHLVPYQNGDLVWKDGPLSEAFRKAKTEKVVLMLDELLRIPQGELSILLTALSPDEAVYRLRTGRMLQVVDGVGQEETLECPCENLAVLATTNVGADYCVSDIDPAVAERFVILRMDTEDEKLKKILATELKAKKFAATWGPKMFTFYAAMRSSVAEGSMKRAPTTRTMTRAVMLAEDANELREKLEQQQLLWVGRGLDGKPVKEQLELIQKLLDKAFK